jgi:Ca-activated chloride channel family protein
MSIVGPNPLLGFPPFGIPLGLPKRDQDSLSEPESFSETESFDSPLKAVDMTGDLNGLMLSLSQRQKYVNTTQDTYEFVYTFPLPYGASLLDLRVTLAGKELVGTVIGRKEAEENYEKAIDEGDSPIMVSQSADGLFTANIGNIKPGEEVTVDVRYAQLLRFEQGHLSLRLPTVIAPRYGDPHAQGGLAPHETDQVDLAADYPLTLKLEIAGELAKARLSSPTHQISCQATGETLTVTLNPGAKLDRDVVINFDDLTGRTFALRGQDEGAEVVLASFCPDLSDPDAQSAPLRLKILVDCSGSMEGDSMEGAKQALRRILKQLDPKDTVSYSRFGSHVEHDMKRLTACEPEALAGLAKLIEATGADLGGTEMNEALISTFKDIGGPEDRADLLLITDGDIWDTDNVVKTARQAGQRVFAIGVSSAPAESLLRKLAEETGGACELITPKDDFEAAMRRQLHRMRGQKAAEVEINWGTEPVWKTVLPKYLYDGETVHVFAAFESPLQSAPQLKWRMKGQDRIAQAGEITPCGNPDLRRLGGRQRMETADQKEALDLALQYQLVSPQSSLFLVRVREEGDKAQGLPKLRQVEQMLAAGYGGTGSVMGMGMVAVASIMPFSPAMPDGFLSKASRFILRKDKGQAEQKARKGQAKLTPLEFLSEFDRLALAATDFPGIVNELEKMRPSKEWQGAVDDLVNGEGLDRLTAWAVMLAWLADKLTSKLSLNRHRNAKRVLRRALGAVADSRQKSLWTKLESQFPSLTAKSWG